MVKGFKAKGKRLTTLKIAKIEELEPLKFPESENNGNESPDEENIDNSEEENLDPDAGKSQQQVIDEITGQQQLFSDEDF